MTPKLRFTFLSLIFLVGAVFCFAFLGKSPLADWDEARHAANAFEMLLNQDWFNYSYRGVPDRWNAKPQGLIWSQALATQVFGPHEFSIRLPSALGAFATGICVYLFALRRLKLSQTLAGWSALVFFCLKGAVGYHTGRTGDMDAAYIGALTLAALCSSRPIVAGFCLSLAFWFKGSALALFGPLILFLCFVQSPLKDLKSFFQAGTKLARGALPLVATWFALQLRYGRTYDDVMFGGRSQIETLFLYDIYMRAVYDPAEPNNRFDVAGFASSFFDLTMPFGVIFVVCVALVLFSRRTAFDFSFLTKWLKGRIFTVEGVLWVFGILLPTCMLISMRNRNPWYSAPMWPYFSILFVLMFSRAQVLISRPRVLQGVALLGLGFALFKQGQRTFAPRVDEGRVWFRESMQRHAVQLQQASEIHLARDLAQGEYATLLWTVGRLPQLKVVNVEPTENTLVRHGEGFVDVLCSERVCQLTWFKTPRK